MQEIQHIKVGDILKLSDGAFIPADCVVLKTHQENGECFIQTDALDGERNFKSKLALKGIHENFQDILLNKTFNVLIPKPTV